METLLRIPMSYQEYLDLPEQPRAEWVDGVVVMMAASPRPHHQRAARRLANLIEQALPECYAEEALSVALPRNRERIPDVLVFEEEPPDVIPVTQTPLLVAEVLSPSTQGEDLLRMGPEYAEAGVGQYWVVNVDTRRIEVHENREGRWELVVFVDDAHPSAEVEVGEHGVVRLDLDAVLR